MHKEYNLSKSKMKNSVKIPFNFETPWKKFSLSQMTKKGNISTYNASVTQRIKGPHKSPTRKDRKLLRHRHIAFSVFYSAILGIQTLRLSLSAQTSTSPIPLLAFSAPQFWMPFFIYPLNFAHFIQHKSPLSPATMVKNLPAMQETRVQFLGQEDPLEKGMAIHSSILAWIIPWTEKSGGLQSMGLQRVRHNWVTNTHTTY